MFGSQVTIRLVWTGMFDKSICIHLPAQPNLVAPHETISARSCLLSGMSDFCYHFWLWCRLYSRKIRILNSYSLACLLAHTQVQTQWEEDIGFTKVSGFLSIPWGRGNHPHFERMFIFYFDSYN